MVLQIAASKQTLMKQTLLLFATILLLSCSVNAQFNKGATLFGGDISAAFSKTQNQFTPDTSKSHALSFSPVFAKAIKDNLFLGVSLTVSDSRNSFLNNGETKATTLGGGVFVRRYKTLFGKFHAFLQAGINASKSTYKSTQPTGYIEKTEGISLYASISPGISVAVSKKLFFEAGFSNMASLDYSFNKQSAGTPGNTIINKSHGFGFSSSLGTQQAGLFFGARIILPH